MRPALHEVAAVFFKAVLCRNLMAHHVLHHLRRCGEVIGHCGYVLCFGHGFCSFCLTCETLTSEDAANVTWRAKKYPSFIRTAQALVPDSLRTQPFLVIFAPASCVRAPQIFYILCFPPLFHYSKCPQSAMVHMVNGV